MIQRIPVDQILIGPNVSAGCNYLKIAGMVYEYRSTSEDREPVPVTVEGPFYRVVDGRHRYLAAVIAGRADLLCDVRSEGARDG